MSAIGPIIFNSVNTFVEKVGRRRIWRYGELDRMLCTWTGPSNIDYRFRPQVDAPHPQYPLMFCTDSQIVSQEAGIAELEATYQGVLVTNGTVPYITEPILTVSPLQGSRDFQVEWTGQMTQVQHAVEYWTGSGTPYTVTETIWLYNVGTQQVNVRYIGESVTVRYHAIPQPDAFSPNYSSLGLPLVKFKVLSTYYGAVSVAATMVTSQAAGNIIANLHIPGIPPLFAAYMGMRMVQKGQWYDVEEIYAPTF